MGRQGDGARMTERIVLRLGGAGRVLGCGNCVGAGSVLSDSERVSRSECYQRVHKKHKTPCTGICVPSYKGFWLDG